MEGAVKLKSSPSDVHREPWAETESLSKYNSDLASEMTAAGEIQSEVRIP